MFSRVPIEQVSKIPDHSVPIGSEPVSVALNSCKNNRPEPGFEAHYHHHPPSPHTSLFPLFVYLRTRLRSKSESELWVRLVKVIG